MVEIWSAYFRQSINQTEIVNLDAYANENGIWIISNYGMPNAGKVIMLGMSPEAAAKLAKSILTAIKIYACDIDNLHQSLPSLDIQA